MKINKFVRFFSRSTPRTVSLLLFVLILGIGINIFLPNQTLQSSQKIADTATCGLYADVFSCNPNGNGEACVQSHIDCSITCAPCSDPNTRCVPTSDAPSNVHGICQPYGAPTPVTCPAYGTLIKLYCSGTDLYGTYNTGTYRSDLTACGTFNNAINNCDSVAGQTCITDGPTLAHCGTSGGTCPARDTNCSTSCNGDGIRTQCANGTCGDYTKDTVCSYGCNATSGTPACYTSPAPNATAVSPSGTVNTLFPTFQVSIDAPWNFYTIVVWRVSDRKIMWDYQPGVYSANGTPGTYSVVYGAGAGNVDWLPQLVSGTQYAWQTTAQYGTGGRVGTTSTALYFTPMGTGSNPTGTATPTPTRTPTPTGSPTPTPTVTPTPSRSPSGTVTPLPTSTSNMNIALDVSLPGISGNPWLGTNTTPIHQTRTFTLQLLDSTGKTVKEIDAPLTFTDGSFKGNVPVSEVPTGNYIIKVRSNNSLYKAIPGVKLLAANTTTTTPQITVVTGNINNTDASLNLLDVLDYNALLSCYNGSTCDSSLKQLADLNDDGTVNSKDLNILLRGFAIRKGD